MTFHRIKAGVAGQRLEHYPPRRVASATWELEDLTYSDDTAGRVLASGSAAVDSVSQTTGALAGPATANARRIALATTTDLTIGRRYEIVAPDGTSEVFELAGVNANSYALARWPLAGTYPTGSTVRGLRLLAADALPSDVYDDADLLESQRKLRVVWTYVTGEIVWVQAGLVRNDAGDLDTIAVAAKVRQQWPDVNTRLEKSGRDVLPDLIAAAQSELRTMLLAKNIAPDRYLMGDGGEWACAWRVLLNMAHTGNVPANTTPEAWQAHCKERFTEFWSPLVLGTPPLETTETDAATDSAKGRHPHSTIVLC